MTVIKDLRKLLVRSKSSFRLALGKDLESSVTSETETDISFGSSRSIGASLNDDKKRRRRRTRKSISHSEPGGNTRTAPEHPNLVAAKAFIQTWINHDMEAGRAFVANGYRIQFRDHEFEFEDFVREFNQIFEAMPDFEFKYKYMVYNFIDNTVILHHMESSGTHTAKPYAFGPCDAIEPKGTHVQNSPETMTLHFDQDGKICKQVVQAHGEMTGPPGIYTQLGGFPLL